jgi:hypothetical protein
MSANFICCGKPAYDWGKKKQRVDLFQAVLYGR